MKKLVLHISILLLSTFTFAQKQNSLEVNIKNNTTVIVESTIQNAVRSTGNLTLGATNEVYGSVVTFQSQQDSSIGYFIVEGNLTLKEEALIAIEKSTIVIVKGDLIIEGKDVIIDIEKKSFLVVAGNIRGNGQGFMLGETIVYSDGLLNVSVDDIEISPITTLPYSSVSFEDNILELVRSEVRGDIPQEFHFFEAFAEEDQVLLSWEVKKDEKPAYFTIEKSSCGKNWIKIDVIPSNTDSDLKEYAFVDNSVKTELYHYRITMVDQEGYISDTIVETVETVRSNASNLITLMN